MRILALHSFYRRKGGEDISFVTEVELLGDRGHTVVVHTVKSGDLAEIRAVSRAARAVWNRAEYANVIEAIKRTRPHVAYLNNIFPGLSASVVDACREEGVPIVYAVRNYRLACISGNLYRAGHDCTSCLDRTSPLGGVLRGCYLGSRGHSAIAAGSLLMNRLAIWRHPVIHFAAVSRHVADFVAALGVPRSHIWVKPNTVSPVPVVDLDPGTGLIFVGRLEPEKGVEQLVQAFHRVARPHDQMSVIGDGALARRLRAKAHPQISFFAEVDHRVVLSKISKARVCAVPSLWHEPFGRVAVESLACGTPVLAANRGGLGDVIEDGITGLLVEPGRAGELSAALDVMLHDDSWSRDARAAARKRFDGRFAPAAVGAVLENILEHAAGAERAPDFRRNPT
jgi:glycosyltransferase involved in cell wall biosynthesis